MKNIFSSRNVAVLISIGILIAHFYLRIVNYNNFSNVLGWDVMAYYIYLPFTFIYHDPGITNHAIVDTIFNTYHPSGTFYQAFQLPNGNWSPMYTMGFAILFLPFFFIGHLWANLGDYAADGFSYPYQVAISTGVMIYIIAGIFIIRKVLLKFFSDKTTIWVLLFMLVGTNYFHEAIIDECGPHASLFAFFALTLYLTIRWHENPTRKNSFWLGLVMGITILARGSSIVLFLIPVLWNVYDKETFLKKWKLFLEKWKLILLAFVGFMIFPAIQMIYWKFITGSFIFNTYKVTPGFDWFDPHISDVLYSYKKGWLVYTPMVILPLIGLFYTYKQNKSIYLSLLLFTIINFYFISSWGTWWGGGSMGHRYFVESYALLALPLGYLIQWTDKKKFKRIVLFLFAFLFVFHNLFQTWQFNNWIFDGYTMTKDYYWKIFLKTSVSDEDRKLRSVVRDFSQEETFKNLDDYIPRTVGYLDFDSINTMFLNQEILDTSFSYSGKYSAKISLDKIYGPTFEFPFNSLTKKDHVWLEISLWYYPIYDLKQFPVTLVAVLDHNKGQYNEQYYAWDLGKDGYEMNKWNKITVYYLTPYPLSRKNDVIKVYPYLRGDKEIFIDNFEVVAWERKW